MWKLKEFFYTIATVLIVMGALFVIQEKVYGLILLIAGIILNVVYRVINLNVDKIKKRNILECIKILNIIFLVFTVFVFFIENEQRFNLLIVAIILDFVVNIKEISFKKN